MSIKSELRHLFGNEVVRQSKLLTPEQVNAQAVAEAAAALRHLQGQPDKQIELVATLPPHTAAALCRWLADPSFWLRVAQVTVH